MKKLYTIKLLEEDYKMICRDGEGSFTKAIYKKWGLGEQKNKTYIRESQNVYTPVDGNVYTSPKTNIDTLRGIISNIEKSPKKDNGLEETSFGYDVPSTKEMKIINEISLATGGFKQKYRDDGEEFTALQLFERRGIRHWAKEYCK